MSIMDVTQEPKSVTERKFWDLALQGFHPKLEFTGSQAFIVYGDAGEARI